MNNENDKFWLELEIGNEAMCSFRNVADALRVVAERVEDGAEKGPVKDLNGNTVGFFRTT